MVWYAQLRVIRVLALETTGVVAKVAKVGKARNVMERHLVPRVVLINYQCCKAGV